MVAKLTATSKNKISSSINRFVNFLKLFTHSKRGILGISILIIAAAVALAAPLLTPYDPVWDYYLTGEYAVPIWFRYFPFGKNLTEHMEPIAQPGFPTSDSLQEWNFTTTSSANVELRYDQIMGRGIKNYGTAVIEFSREAGSNLGEVKAYLSYRFFYPFTGSPKSFRCYVAVLTEGAENLEKISINAYLRRIEGNNTSSYAVWLKGITRDPTDWITPDPPIDSYQAAFKQQYFEKYIKQLREKNITASPESIVFTKPTTYEYLIEMNFVDSKLTTRPKDIETTVYIDDLNVKLYGSAFGLLGTDHMGRDIFTQLVHGARLSLLVGLLSAVLSVSIGLAVGLVSGYFGKLVDEVVMRFNDMLLVLPALPLLIALITVLGPSLWNLILLIGVLGWMGFARVVRAQVLSLRERPFVEAAKAVGAGKFHIIARHILPNVMSLTYVSLALAVPSAIISEAALSWLGLFDPHVMSWGRMLYDVQFHQGTEMWWWVVPPGLCIALVSLSFILIGYTLDEILNPKLRVRR